MLIVTTHRHWWSLTQLPGTPGKHQNLNETSACMILFLQLFHFFMFKCKTMYTINVVADLLPTELIEGTPALYLFH